MVNEQVSEQTQLAKETKQERREKRWAKKKNKMLHHGKGLARVYKDAISKRTKATKTHE